VFEISAPETLRGEKPRLLWQVHEAIRRLHYSRRTEEAYVHWIKRFIFWSGKRHPSTLGEAEVSAFLSHLAVEFNVAAATQNQAPSALLAQLDGVHGLMAGILYGCGLRLMECLRLRVKDVDFAYCQILVRDGKAPRTG
jgi:integrase